MITETVTKKKVLIETRVIVEPKEVPCWYRRTEEDRLKYLKDWADELMSFFRDHRSQDVNSVYAEPVYEVQCTGCGREWEEMIEDGTVYCANCGLPIEVCN